MSDNGHISLSAIDFLGLTKQRKVSRIDLTEVGYEGVIYVRDLTASEQARITGVGKGNMARFYNDKSYAVDLSALSEAAGPKFLAEAVVTDTQDGALLERAFAADPEADYLMFPSTELVQMADVWIRESGNRDKMEKALGQMPNAVTNLVIRQVKILSGMAEDAIEEKKDSS